MGSTEFGGRVAFFDTDASGCSFTGDRTEFLGRNGGMGAPAAMQRERLSGRLGVGLDPCAAIQVPMSLLDGEASETVFRLGMGKDYEDALYLARDRIGVKPLYVHDDGQRMVFGGFTPVVELRA